MRSIDSPELRELNLRWPISRSLLRSGNFAGLQVMAIMLWPGDEAKRQEFLATMIAADIGSLESCAPKGPGLFEALHATISERLNERFLEHGGHDAVARAPGYDALEKALDDSLEECRAAGCILIGLTALATEPEAGKKGGASINKAIAIFEQPFQKKHRWLKRAWSRRRSVAHLCAGAVVIHRLLRKLDLGPGYPFIEALVWTLALGRAYQKWGLSHKPAHGKPMPFLPPYEIVWIPDDLPLRDVPLPSPRLGAEGLAALRRYKAPSA